MNRAERRAQERKFKKARSKIQKSPEVIKAREEILKLLAAFFEKEPTKIHAWLVAPNPNLGGVSPAKMIAAGRHARLAEFVKAQMSESGFDVEAILAAGLDVTGLVLGHGKPPETVSPEELDERLGAE